MRASPPLGQQLLEPEDPDTTHVEDVEAWINIYSELVKFQQNVLTRLTNGEAGPPDGHLGGRANLGALQRQLHAYRARLEYWYSRRWEMRGVVMDPETRSVAHRGRSVSLTPREFALLSVLVESSGQALRPRRLIVQAWHDSALSNEQLRVYITRLRKKLHQIALADIVIQAGQGYLLIFRGPDSQSHPRGSAGSSV
jgi:DNA-binding response OmpR family regulator